MTRLLQLTVALLSACLTSQSFAEKSAVSREATAFGARQSIVGLSLSPDGSSVAYIAPGPGQASALYTQTLETEGKAKLAASASGKPERLDDCSWVTND